MAGVNLLKQTYQFESVGALKGVHCTWFWYTKTPRGIQENTEAIKKFKSKTSRPCRNEAMSVEHKVNKAGGHDIFIQLQHINYVLYYSASAFTSWGTPSPHMI